MSPLHLLPTLTRGLFGLQLSVSPPAPVVGPAVGPANPELAAEATVAPWVPEHGAEAHGAEAHGADADPREGRDQMRRAARATIAGGALVLLGMVGTTTGLALFIAHGRQLERLREDNGGRLPPGNDKRQAAIRLHGAVIPTVAVASTLALAGLVTALVAGRRFRRLRDERGSGKVAFAPVPTRHGFGITAGVRF